jgi:hypothetical protein
MRDDVILVIRSVGEKTEKVCYDIACDQVGEENVIIIHEKPFWKAIKKTFELGVSSNKKWTLALDADVLLKENAVDEMILNAKKYGSKLFVYQGWVTDKIFGANRSGGPHLYYNENINFGISINVNDTKELRPESFIHKEVKSKFGLKKIVDKKVFGVHDFWQSNFDYYRKCYLHGIKHAHFGGMFFQNNIKYYKQDEDYRAMLKGWIKALESNEIVEVDIDYLEKNLKCDYNKLLLKGNQLNNDLSLKEVYSKIDDEMKKATPANFGKKPPIFERVLKKINKSFFLILFNKNSNSY